MITLEKGRTVISTSPEKIGDIEHLPLEERTKIILEQTELSPAMHEFTKNIKKVNYLSEQKGVNIEFEDIYSGDTRISSLMNMILGEKYISLRLFLDGMVNHSIIYDLLKIHSALTETYKLKDSRLYLGPKEMTEVIPAIEGPYVAGVAKRLHDKLYSPEMINETRKMVALRVVRHDQLQERADELYSKKLLEFLGLSFSSQ
jgi:hypothetical protein